MPPKIEFTPIQDLFEPTSPVPKKLMKQAVVTDFKSKALVGVPDTEISITFSPDEGSDILIHRVDPENALGYSVFASENDYFNHLQADLYEPTEEEVLGGMNE